MKNVAGKCTCCVCQNKHCLVYHPGHDHRIKEEKSSIESDDWWEDYLKRMEGFMESGERR